MPLTTQNFSHKKLPVLLIIIILLGSLSFYYLFAALPFTVFLPATPRTVHRHQSGRYRPPVRTRPFLITDACFRITASGYDTAIIIFCRMPEADADIFSLVAIPPLIWRSALLISRTTLACAARDGLIFSRRSVTSLCTVDFEIPNFPCRLPHCRIVINNVIRYSYRPLFNIFFQRLPLKSLFYNVCDGQIKHTLIQVKKRMIFHTQKRDPMSPAPRSKRFQKSTIISGNLVYFHLFVIFSCTSYHISDASKSPSFLLIKRYV